MKCQWNLNTFLVPPPLKCRRGKTLVMAVVEWQSQWHDEVKHKNVCLRYFKYLIKHQNHDPPLPKQLDSNKAKSICRAHHGRKITNGLAGTPGPRSVIYPKTYSGVFQTTRNYTTPICGLASKIGSEEM